MQDLKKNKRKVTNKKQAPMINQAEVIESCIEERLPSEISRSCKKTSCCNTGSCGCNKPEKHECECHCVCECNSHKKECEPCDIEAETCFDNPCGPTCCNPIIPQNINISCAVPYAIEANRIFDTMRFQVFTDGTDENGAPLNFEVDVVEVKGSIPVEAQVGVTIDKICINYDDIYIDPGCISLEEYEIDMPRGNKEENCRADFEYQVCGLKSGECCSQGKGKSVSYKQRGLVVEVEGLVLELRGSCGCTEFVAIAQPVIRKDHKQCTPKRVKFIFNTLSAPICTPSNGKDFTLRQNYQTSLTVDCIGKSYLCCTCHEGERYCELEIPNGIDIICCLQETVSILVGEQMVVLGANHTIEPRVVDTFSKVCDFRECGLN